MTSAVYLIGSGLPIEILKLIEPFLVQLRFKTKHSWIQLSKAGNLNGLRWLYRYHIASYETSNFAAAAAYGHLHILKWFWEMQFLCFSHYPMNIAALNGHLHILKWMHAKQLGGCSPTAMDYAAKNGHLDIVQWLHENRKEGCTHRAMNWAARNGHLHVIQWLHTHRTEGCDEMAMDFAAEMGHLDIVKWLHTHRPEGCTGGAISFAAKNGHFEIVRWLCTHRNVRWPRYALVNAARFGHFEILKYLHSRDRRYCGSMLINAAISSGHGDIADWILENRRSERPTEHALDGAAAEGHLHMFEKYGSSLGYSYVAMENAASYGHLEILKWIHEHEKIQNWSCRTIDFAIENQHFEIAKWIFQTHKTACTQESIYLLAENGALEMLKWIKSEGILNQFEFLYHHPNLPVDDDDDDEMREIMFSTIHVPTLLYCAVLSKDLKVVQWVCAEYPQVFKNPLSKSIIAATRKNFYEGLEYLLDNFECPAPLQSFLVCIQDENLDMLFWLCRKFPEQTRRFLPDLLENYCIKEYVRTWLTKYVF